MKLWKPSTASASQKMLISSSFQPCFFSAGTASVTCGGMSSSAVTTWSVTCSILSGLTRDG